MLAQFATASGQTTGDIDKIKLAAEVCEQFIHTWDGYEKYAWGHDGLRPLSDTCQDWYGTPFYITAVDGLDTISSIGAGIDSYLEYLLKSWRLFGNKDCERINKYT